MAVPIITASPKKDCTMKGVACQYNCFSEKERKCDEDERGSGQLSISTFVFQDVYFQRYASIQKISKKYLDNF